MKKEGTVCSFGRSLRIGIACGGTGGHVFPGLATAMILRSRGHDVTLWLAGRNEERAALEGSDLPVMVVRSTGYALSLSYRGLAAPFRLIIACLRCFVAMRRARPDVMLAMGSHASVGPALAARLLGVPLVLHEANVVPGRAIRFLAPFALAVAVGFEETRKVLRHKRMFVTGMPLRKATDAASVEALFPGLRDDGFVVLVMGGSRGAHGLNMIASAAIARLRRAGRDIRVIHLAGVADEAVVRRVYAEHEVPCAVFGFLETAGAAYRRATLAVCRAGASTCAELAHYGVPALLIPYPLATHQHQLANARAVERSGAVDVIEEKNVNEEWLADYLARQMDDAPRLDDMARSAKGRDAGDAASALADLIEHRIRR